MSVHPAVLQRYRHMRAKHRSIGVPGEHTAAREIEAIDPYGVLSMALEIGEERAARLLEVRVEAVEGGES